MKRSKGILWLVVLLSIVGGGCAVGQRKIVVQPEQVASQNDADWQIKKQPQGASQTR